MTARVEGLRALCHELYEPQSVSEIYQHIKDIADASSYIQQCSRQLADQLHKLCLDGALAVDNLPSSYPDPVAAAIAYLSDSVGSAAHLSDRLQSAGGAASHLYQKDTGE
jgi:hypothetical protein